MPVASSPDPSTPLARVHAIPQTRLPIPTCLVGTACHAGLPV